MENDILLAILRSQLRIEMARYKASYGYVLNSSMIVQSNITMKVIEEIQAQIKELEQK